MLICGSVSTTNAPHVILRLAEARLIEGVVCVRACEEAEKNIVDKFSEKAVVARRLLRQIVNCLTIIPTPSPEEVKHYIGQAQPKDLPHFVAAIQQHCQYFITLFLLFLLVKLFFLKEKFGYLQRPSLLSIW